MLIITNIYKLLPPKEFFYFFILIIETITCQTEKQQQQKKQFISHIKMQNISEREEIRKCEFNIS